MPTVLRVNNYRFFFYSFDRVEPYHIHVESDDSYAKYWLSPVRLSKSVGYSIKELKIIHEIVLKNEKIFKEKWNEYFKD
jgi:hypothetical protein